MSELRNIRWGKLVRDFLSKESLKILDRSSSLQWALTYCLRQQGMMVIDDLDELVLDYQGVKFRPDVLNYPRMFEAPDRYVLDRVKATDTVLDLGANIGSFTLQAARKGAKVLAYEPLFTNELLDNIYLNKFENVEVSSSAIGDGKSIKVDCQEYSRVVGSWTFGDVREKASTVDFLRMDIGGWEWKIDPGALLGIRDLEIEFHFWDRWQGKIANWTRWKEWLDSQGYGYRARWSKSRHWLYLSASLESKEREEVHLTNGSFRGKTRQQWRGTEASI
jgi:FkbM family methyltransferase